MVAGLVPATHVAIDTRRFQTRGQIRAQKQMVEA